MKKCPFKHKGKDKVTYYICAECNKKFELPIGAKMPENCKANDTTTI
jgi:hypothetical protein